MKIYIPENLRVFVRTYDNMIYLAPDNKTASALKMFETGRKWAGSQCNEFVVENKNITISVLDAPTKSNLGGKLSFCICGVKFDGNENTYSLGINTVELVEFLKKTTCVNGVFAEKSFFVRAGASWELGHNVLDDIKRIDLINDNCSRKKYALSKTYITGRIFNNSSNKEYVFVNHAYSYVGETSNVLNFYLEPDGKPLKRNILVQKNAVKNQCLSLNRLYEFDSIISTSKSFFETENYITNVNNAYIDNKRLKDMIMNETDKNLIRNKHEFTKFIILCFTSFERGVKPRYTEKEAGEIYNKVILPYINAHVNYDKSYSLISTLKKLFNNFTVCE